MSRASPVTVARSPTDTDGSRDGRARPRTEARRGRRDHAGAQRAASGASGLDRIVGVMSASRSYDALPLNCGRGATMGPPACSAQSSPVVFRPRCCTRLQGLSSSWDDWRGQKVFLIRKRSQVRVLDRPSTGIQDFPAYAKFSRIWLLEGRHGRGVPWGHNGATGGYRRRESALGFPLRLRRPHRAGGLLKSGKSSQPDGWRVAALTAEGQSAEDARQPVRFVHGSGAVRDEFDAWSLRTAEEPMLARVAPIHAPASALPTAVLVPKEKSASPSSQQLTTGPARCCFSRNGRQARAALLVLHEVLIAPADGIDDSTAHPCRCYFHDTLVCEGMP